MKTLVVLVSLFAGSFAHADYHGKTICKGFYAASGEAVYNNQSADLGKKSVSDDQSTRDKFYTLSVQDAWPFLYETKSGKHVSLENASMGDGMRIFISDDLDVYPENVPGVRYGKGRVIVLCKTEPGGF
ncbi:hypothetical protein [Bdellovibrio sp. HCB288]|uniref:hypothetical protein n=1 Tax=Bdellovibrio sp. HCB288 TaxID=3394355 RepID=UPI0039B642D2